VKRIPKGDSPLESSPQGEGKPHPYYTRAGQAILAWKKDEPGGRPDLLKFAPGRLRPLHLREVSGREPHHAPCVGKEDARISLSIPESAKISGVSTVFFLFPSPPQKE